LAYRRQGAIADQLKRVDRHLTLADGKSEPKSSRRVRAADGLARLDQLVRTDGYLDEPLVLGAPAAGVLDAHPPEPALVDDVSHPSRKGRAHRPIFLWAQHHRRGVAPIAENRMTIP